MSPLFNPAGGMAIGGTVTSGTAGSALFVGAGPVLAEDNANFFWDNTNKRLGIAQGVPPTYTLHAQRTETAIAGTTSAALFQAVQAPPSASAGAHFAKVVNVETGAGVTQNFTNIISGSFYSVTHRSTGTLQEGRGLTLNMATTATAGAAVAMTGMKASTSFANAITQVHGLEWTTTVAATGAITSNRCFAAGTPIVVAGGTIGTAIGLLAFSQGATGVTSAVGVNIAAQSGASFSNTALLIGTFSPPSGTHAIYVAAGAITLVNSVDIVLGTGAGTKIGTGTTQKLGFYNATPVVRQTDGANLTNNVTVGGTTDTIANYTDLVIYANDAAAIRNDIYQLARKVKIIGDALRTYGLLS